MSIKSQKLVTNDIFDSVSEFGAPRAHGFEGFCSYVFVHNQETSFLRAQGNQNN